MRGLKFVQPLDLARLLCPYYVVSLSLSTAVVRSLILPIMDYSDGVLNSMASNFFPDLRRSLGPYLVDKTKLIENIVDRHLLTGHVSLVLRPRRCGKSTMLQMLK